MRTYILGVALIPAIAVGSFFLRHTSQNLDSSIFDGVWVANGHSCAGGPFIAFAPDQIVTRSDHNTNIIKVVISGDAKHPTIQYLGNDGAPALTETLKLDGAMLLFESAKFEAPSLQPDIADQKLQQLITVMRKSHPFQHC